MAFWSFFRLSPNRTRKGDSRNIRHHYRNKQDSGKSPAVKNETQIHFMATTDRSESFRLDWEHMLPAFSSADLAPGASTPPPHSRVSARIRRATCSWDAQWHTSTEQLDTWMALENRGAIGIVGPLMRRKVRVFSPAQVGRPSTNDVRSRLSRDLILGSFSQILGKAGHRKRLRHAVPRPRPPRLLGRQIQGSR